MKQSAGLLIYKIENGQVKVLLGHMGGPFYAKKDEGAWDIPKGEYEDEDALTAAHREFEEEIGQPAPTGRAYDLGEIKASGKIVKIWAIEGDLDVSRIDPDTFTMEWPPKSGKIQEFPEIDKAKWFTLPIAVKKVNQNRRLFIERLAGKLRIQLSPEPEQRSLF